MNLQEFIHDTTFDSLPEAALHDAVRCLTDTLGVAIAGSQTALSKIIHTHATRQFGGNAATLWQDGRSASPAGAALANAMTIDALDAHDGHKLTKGHVGCGVVPGLIAVMQAEGVTRAKELLTSIVIGYEIGTRAGMALHASACDYHTSGAWISLATAALGARQLGLTSAQTKEALGIAEYHGPRSQMMRCIEAPTMVKDGSGWGAMAGVSAAYLAQDGFTGAPAITVEAPNLGEFWQDIGYIWYVGQQYVKLYPVCRWAQPAVEAVLALSAKHGISAKDVAAIYVETFHEALCLNAIPTTTEQAQYSLPFSVAAALVRGTIGVCEISHDGLRDTAIMRLAKRVKITQSASFNAAFPARRFAKVSLELHDGQVVTSPSTEAKGDPENKVSDAVIWNKFRKLAAPVIGINPAQQLLADLQALPSTENTERLFSQLSAPPAA